MNVNVGEDLLVYIEDNDVLFPHPISQLSHRQVKKLCEGMAEYNRQHQGAE